MTAFPPKARHADRPARFCRVAACLIAVILAGVAPGLVSAQPIELTPPLENLDRPPQAGPRDGQTPSPLVPQNPRDLRGKSGVIIQDLGEVNADSSGVLTVREEGLGADMWAGTPRTRALDLLRAQPADTRSAAIRDLLRRLLLSRAQPPEGDGPSGQVLAARAELLGRLGMAEGVKALSDALGRGPRPEGLALVEMDSRWLSANHAEACAVANNYIQNAKDPYFFKAFAFCQVLRGEKENARLRVDLLREMGEEDALYYALMRRALAGSKRKIKDTETSSEPLRPLHLAMFTQTGVPLPKDVAEKMSVTTAVALAKSDHTDPRVRLNAAEIAAGAGALDAVALREAYQSAALPKAEKGKSGASQALAGLGDLKTPAGRARAYRQAINETVTPALAEVLRAMLDGALQANRFRMAAIAFRPMLQSVPPTGEYLYMAPLALRAAIAAEDRDMARGWLELLRRNATGPGDYASAYWGSVLAARFITLPEAEQVAVDAAARNLAIQASRQKTTAMVEPQRLFSVLEGFGNTIDIAVWRTLFNGGTAPKQTIPSPSSLWALQDAAVSGRRAETVLLAAMMLGQEGPAGAAPYTLQRVLQALNDVGLEKDARAIALEAVIAAQ